MIITLQSKDGQCVLQLEGRLDANWADYLAKQIESVIRTGHHELDLDFARISYISSAGIRVLLKYYRQLKTAGGLLRVFHPTESVLAVLRLSGLDGILLTQQMRQEAPAKEEPARAPGAGSPARSWKRDGVEFEGLSFAATVPLEGQLLGRPELFASGQLSAADANRLRCTADTLAVGLGAFGSRPEDTESRFGEALAVAGMAVALPADGSSVPDYQVTEGQLVPELHLIYGISARGRFSRWLRFEAVRSQRGVISLADLVDAGLEDLGTPCGAFAILAESSGVVGAMLKRSPVLANGQATLAFPAVRDWLTFTTERTDEKNLAMIVGIAERSPTPKTAAWLRPIGPGTGAYGHFHAAVFPYRPLPKGRMELAEAVSSLTASESAQAVMHLLADSREFDGIGQTDLMRGMCWIGPLKL
jgi:anti-anti-sigma factor